MASDPLKRLKKAIDQIKPQLVEARIDVDKWLMLADVFDDAMCVTLIQKLEAFVAPGTPFHSFNKIYSTQDSTWWQNMRMLGTPDLRERKLLATEAIKLRKAWRMFGGKVKAKSDEVEGATA